MKRSFEHLVFDLDDTLLDTHRQLVPRAARDACIAMIETGLKTTLSDCLRAWENNSKSSARREVFQHLVEKFGILAGRDAEAVRKKGYDAFYDRTIDGGLTLPKGVREMLERLHEKYSLHLVTSGVPRTQQEKIDVLGLRPYFDSITIVDSSRGETKSDAFARIMKSTRALPTRHLSIGNRVDTDISEARALGWQACWVRYGEYVALEPRDELEQPEYTVNSITELEDVCQL